MFETMLVGIILLLVGMIIVYFFCYLTNHHALLMDSIDELNHTVKYLHDKIEMLTKKIDAK